MMYCAILYDASFFPSQSTWTTVLVATCIKLTVESLFFFTVD